MSCHASRQPERVRVNERENGGSYGAGVCGIRAADRGDEPQPAGPH